MEQKEASKRKRLINFIIDVLVILLLMEITFQIEEILENKLPIKILRLIMVFGYYILLEYFLGKTVGKFVTKTRVVDKKGNKIDFRTAIIRYLCRWIPFEFLSLGLGADAKAWHDVLSKTHVIDENRSE